MVKSATKFRPLLHDYPGLNINSMFTVVRVLDTDYRGRLYEVVSNKYCRVKITEENLRELANITNVAGVWIHEDRIEVIDGVLYEDRRAASKEKAVEAVIDPPEQSNEPTSMDEVFGAEGGVVASESVEPVEESAEIDSVKTETSGEEEQNLAEETPASKNNDTQGKKAKKTANKK